MSGFAFGWCFVKEAEMMAVSRTTWILIILVLAFSLVAVIPWAMEQLSLTPGTIAPGWQVRDQKVILFPYRTTSERLYDSAGLPTTFYGFPIDRTALPWDVWLENETVQITITDTWQDSEGCALKFEYLGKEYTIYLYRPSGRTYPAELSDNLRIYILKAELPERAGEYFTASGTNFYAFKSVTLSLVRKV